MRSFCVFWRRIAPLSAALALFFGVAGPVTTAKEAISPGGAPSSLTQEQAPAPVIRQAPEAPPDQPDQQTSAAQGQNAGYQAPGSNFDDGLFQRRIPKEQLA